VKSSPLARARGPALEPGAHVNRGQRSAAVPSPEYLVLPRGPGAGPGAGGLGRRGRALGLGRELAPPRWRRSSPLGGPSPPGRPCLIHAAAGGDRGRPAVRLAKHYGANTVIAAASAWQARGWSGRWAPDHGHRFPRPYDLAAEGPAA